MFYLGYVKHGEDVFEAAQRETKEETGLRHFHYKVLDGFREQLAYLVRGRRKEVHYWLAELTDPNTQVILSKEHKDSSWANLTQTKVLSGKEDLNACLDRAEHFIRNSE